MFVPDYLDALFLETQWIVFFPRFLGNEGPTGIPGPVGPSGPKGERGAEGQVLSGVTYNRWGRTNCSGDASVIYTGTRITSIYFFKTIYRKQTDM